ncbi:hypothetical protein CY35_10G095400 [Sphagnum magellanicum]|nr:hypothetical protein CY35_10G095400 [Sphagnum magellanicum]
MESVDMFNAATAPLTFHDFLDRMRHPLAADFVRSIKTFIMDFTTKVPDPDSDSESVQTFLSTTEGAFQAHPLFANATDEELESAGEGLEKYLMTKLFARAFAPLPEEVEHDQRLSEKMGMLQQFIRPEHLDIPPSFQNESSWLLAQKELQKINTYKAPRDKLVCILNCCRVINNLLLNVSLATNDNPSGADDFLPILIYIVIKANPPQLHSNLLYISRYRHRSRLISEASYFYTNLVSAETFISTLEAKSLSMDKGEYEKQLQAARAVLDGMNMPSPLPSRTVPQETHGLVGREEEHASLPSNEAANKIEPGPGLTIHKEDQIESPLLPAASTSAIVASTNALHSPKESKQRNLGASIKKLEAAAIPAVLEADRSGQLAIDYPYLYASAGDLRVADVESLLSAYKELALKYCVLCKAVEGTGISEKNHRVSSPVVDSKDAGTARFSSTAELESAPESTSHSESMAVTGEQSILKEEQAPDVKRTIQSDGLQDLFDGMHVRGEGSDEGKVSSPESPTFGNMGREEYPSDNHSGREMEPQPEKRVYNDESAVEEEHVVAEDTGHSSHEIFEESRDPSIDKEEVVESVTG